MYARGRGRLLGRSKPYFAHGGCARFSSALTSNDFIKSTSLIEYSPEQFAAAADDIIRLAEVEGLDAHARSVKIRRQK